MKALIGYSRCWMTREAFLRAGMDTYTCDLLPAREDDPHPELHLQMDVYEAIASHRWSFGLFHPMCTYLTVSAAWAFKDPDYDKYPGVGYHQKPNPAKLYGAARRAQREIEITNFQRLLSLPFPCELENPALNFVSAVVGSPDQVIQPHQFGDDASKATGLWFNPAARARSVCLSFAALEMSHRALSAARSAGPTRLIAAKIISDRATLIVGCNAQPPTLVSRQLSAASTVAGLLNAMNSYSLSCYEPA